MKILKLSGLLLIFLFLLICIVPIYSSLEWTTLGLNGEFLTNPDFLGTSTFQFFIGTNDTVISSSNVELENVTMSDIGNITAPQKLYPFPSTRDRYCLEMGFSSASSGVNILSTVGMYMSEWDAGSSEWDYSYHSAGSPMAYNITCINETFSQNISYILNGNTIELCTNCNNQIFYETGLYGLNTVQFLAINGSENVTTSVYNIYYDTVDPIINSSLPSEINYYTFNFTDYINYSDVTPVTCRMYINNGNNTMYGVKADPSSFNVSCDNAYLALNVSGIYSYMIEAVDIAGNTAEYGTGVVFMPGGSIYYNQIRLSPYQYIRFYDNERGLYLTDYSFIGYNSTGEYIIFPLYDFGLGNFTRNFSHLGYLNRSINFTLQNTSFLNESYNVTPAKILITVFDETSHTTQLTFNITMYNNTDSEIFLNQTNFEIYTNDTVTGEVGFIIESSGYAKRRIYIDINEFIVTSHVVYLLPSVDAVPVTFRTLDVSQKPIEDGVLTFYKMINGTNTYLAQAKTDSQGRTYFNMDPYEDYTFAITKNGYVMQLLNTVPGKTEYDIILVEDDVLYGFIYDGFSYSINPDYMTTLQNITVTIIDADNKISSLFVTVSCINNITGGDYTESITSTISNGGIFTFDPDECFRYTINITSVRDGDRRTRIEYIDHRLPTSSTANIENASADMDTESDISKAFLIIIAYIIFCAIGSFYNPAFGAILGCVPLLWASSVGWLSLGFCGVFCMFTILGGLYFNR